MRCQPKLLPAICITNVDGWDGVTVWNGRMESAFDFYVILFSTRHTVTGVL